MTIRLPICYCETRVTDALVDNELKSLSSLYLSCEIPRKVREMTRGRPDVLQALLTEDEELQKRVKPFYTRDGTQIRLVHVAVRPELVTVLMLPRLRPSDKLELTAVRSLIGRITHANGDRRDCRSENLREVTG